MTALRSRIAALTVPPILLISLAACGEDDPQAEADTDSSDRSASPSPIATPTSPATPTTSPTSIAMDLGDDSEVMADVLQAAIPSFKVRIQMTEDNDENDLFGRPGQYDQVTFIGDTRLGCSAHDDFNNLDTACGVKIERWPSEAAAEARAEYIQQKLKEFGLGAEWDYVVDRLVVRASGDYKPSQAAEIQNASTASAPVAPPE